MSDNNAGFSEIAKPDQGESNKTILPVVLFLILLPTVHRFDKQGRKITRWT